MRRTGHGAENSHRLDIIAGRQTMTVYKYVPAEAKAAADAAVALLKGKKPKTNSTRPNGAHPEPTYAIPVISINRVNFRRLFTDKFLKKSDVCVGEFAKYCVKPARRRPEASSRLESNRPGVACTRRRLPARLPHPEGSP